MGILFLVLIMSLSIQAGGASYRGHSNPPSHASALASNQATTRPITTGTSVLGVKYRGGVMLAADTLCSYGSLAKYKNAQRLLSINSRTLIGASGEYSDLQAIHDLLRPTRWAFLYFARLPYEQRVSAASMTPPRYLTPRTEVPVVIGRVVAWLEARALAWEIGLGWPR